jgi:hypothetical protein
MYSSKLSSLFGFFWAEYKAEYLDVDVNEQHCQKGVNVHSIPML